jgi:protein SCO1/2
MRGARPWTLRLGLSLGLGALAGGLSLGSTDARAADEIRSPEASEIDVLERLGEHVDAELQFKDQNGETVHFGDFFDGERPVLVTLNYFRCPVLCNIQLNELTETLREMEWTAGDENFRIVTVSIDPREDVELAKAKRANHLEALDRGDQVEWDFLTGDALDIRLLAAQLGVSYAYDGEKDQYAHPPVIMFLSPERKIARYLYGLTYHPRDLKFALMDAANGKVGTTGDRLIFSCFHYDATLGRYGKDAQALMSWGGVAVVLGLGSFLFVLWRRERHRNDASPVRDEVTESANPLTHQEVPA